MSRLSDAEIDAWDAINHAEHMHVVKRTRERLDQLKVAELRALHVHYFDHPKLAAELNKQCLIDELVEPIMEEDR